MSHLDVHFRRNARRHPAREALITAERTWTWGELDDEVGRLAQLLREAGVGAGDRVAVMAGNGAPFVLAFHAILRARAVLVPVNSRLAPPEVAHIVGDSGAKLLLVGRGEAIDAVTQARPGAVEHVRLDELLDRLPQVEPLGDGAADESDDAFILYTSGTTGDPKGVQLDHRRAMWAGLSEVASLPLADGDRYLHIAPLYHSGGIVYLVTTTLLGGTNVVLPAFEPGAVLEAIAAHRCTTFLGVPTMYQLLLDHPGFGEHDLSSWKLGIFGAAPMPEHTLSAMLERLPDVRLVQLCGQTEGGPGGVYATADQVRARPEVTGWQAMAFYEARIVGADGEDVGDGEVGQLLLRGEGVMKGYWGHPEATAETLRDGWLHTGDLFRRDADGALTIVDRLKDVVITGGRNVYSVEVERVLADHPDVAEIAIVGRPHPTYGESIVAVVRAAGHAPTLEELRAHCRGRLADFKAPHDLELVDELPRNASGKVLKRELRAAAG